MEDETSNNPDPANPVKKARTDNNYQTIDAFLLEVGISLTNSDHAEIAPVLLAHGYSPLILDMGKALLETATNKHHLQKKVYGDKFEATDNLHALWDIAKALYDDHLDIARIAFKNQKGVLAQLGAFGERKLSYTGWLGQAKGFYKNLLDNPEFMAGMAKFGQTETIISAASEAMNAVETALAIQQSETGKAQTATQNRDLALEALTNWNDDFVGIAQVAFNKKPYLLEILGLKGG